MTTQQKATNETQEMTAKNLLKDFLDQEGLRIEKLEAITPREAVARVDLRQLGLRTVSAELADKNSGLWTKDSNPCHPYRFACSDGFPIPAAKMETLKKSYAYISFSPDGQSAVAFLVEELAVFGKVVPAADGKEAFYYLPLEVCGIGRVIEGKFVWRLPPGCGERRRFSKYEMRFPNQT